MQHECDTSTTRETRVRYERQKCDIIATRTTRMQDEYYPNDTSATQAKMFDFDNDASENIFSHHFIYYIASERLQREEHFILRTTFWKCLAPMTKCV